LYVVVLFCGLSILWSVALMHVVASLHCQPVMGSHVRPPLACSSGEGSNR
jgi:hypothetical protein